ncbi:hypothetical protein N7G274_009208 [Stereocaulon virgatum]|uniref:PROP1-like PPR domain-containing protein n=1 Tax=Stereocaulon virgatum TaxID=373712 RepID=A0ABR3ZXR6_9LECA
MIERAAICFETGRHIIRRQAENSFRSRRCLHSAFWSHGAGNINLPAWWIFFLQASDANDQTKPWRAVHVPGERVSGALREIFLGFLYPVQTLALIRRLKRSTIAHQHASQNVKHSCRHYTSIAEDVITGISAVEAGAASVAPANTADELRQNINQILENDAAQGLNDQLWQYYQDFLETSESLSQHDIVKMLRFLGQSKRVVDMERLVALFESIPVRQRSAIHYNHVVSAALSLKDLGTAIAIHREAYSRIAGSIGTSAILRYTIQHNMWEEAIEVWNMFWADQFTYFSKPEIWAEVDALPLTELMGRAASAADFANSMSETAAHVAPITARNFALELVRRALHVHNTAFDVARQRDMLTKARVLDSPDSKLPVWALNQLLSFDSREHGHQALHLYRVLRKQTGFRPAPRVLHSITEKLIVNSSTSNLSMIVDDWRKYQGGLPAKVAIDVAWVLAERGELEALRKLFNEFCSEHGPPRETLRFYHALLHVHKRRADTEGIVRTWDELQADFGFKPGPKAWNSVISTFARVGDIDGAWAWFEKMRVAGLRPGCHVFFSMMSMYARKGDRDAVDDLFQMSQAEGVEPNALMIDAIVQANINDERLDEAEQLVLRAGQMKLEGSRTFMWNILLNAYALRRDSDKVNALHRRMKDEGVEADNMTFAALMTALSIAKMPDAAKKIMVKVMPRANVKRTAIHYAIVMNGYLATREYGKVFELYKSLLAEGLTPNTGIQNVLLRAAASVDKAYKTRGVESGGQPGAEPGDQTTLVRAEQILDQAIANINPSQLAASEPRKFSGHDPINEAFSSSHFEYLIFLYGQDGAFDKVSALYDRYLEIGSKYTTQDIEASPPIRLLTALMVTHLRAKNYEDIERCWALALDKSEKIARKSSVTDTSQPNWVLHSRRFILNLPLVHYINALSAQDQIDSIISTVNHLHEAGFALNSPTWNLYIRTLATSRNLSHQALAFRYCEAELMPSWPGWAHFRDPQYMKANKFIPITRNTLLIPQMRMPAYLTLVHLARCYVVAKRRRRGDLTVTQLGEMAPKTVDALLNMPKLEDRAQNEILRSEGHL